MVDGSSRLPVADWRRAWAPWLRPARILDWEAKGVPEREPLPRRVLRISDYGRVRRQAGGLDRL